MPDTERADAGLLLPGPSTRTTSSPDGSRPRALGLPGLQRPAAGSTSARASRRSSASRCSRPWRPACSSSRPTAAARRPTSSEGVTGFLTATWDADRLARRASSAALDALARRDGRPRAQAGPARWCADRFTIQRMASDARRRLPRRRARRESAHRSALVGRRMTLLVISPGLRLAPAPAGHARHGVAGRAASGWSSPPGRPRRASWPSFGFERRRPAARPRLQPGRDRAPTSSPPDEARLAARILRRHPPRHGADAHVPGARAAGRPHVAARSRRRARRSRSSMPCAPTPSSSTTSRSAPASACGPATSRTPTSCSGTRRRCRSATRSTAAAAVAGARSDPDPARARRAATVLCRAGRRRLHRRVESRRRGARRRCGSPSTTPSPSTGRWCSTTTPTSWSTPERAPLLPPHRFLGSTLRAEPADPEVEAWLGDAGAVRLRQLRQLPLGARRRAAHGWSTRCASAGVRAGRRDRLDAGRRAGRPPAGLARARRTSRRCDCSGRPPRRSRTAATTRSPRRVGTGVPLLVLPFSTDQFAGAAAIERSGLGVALDPNAASVDELAAGIAGAVDRDGHTRGRLRDLAARQAAKPGPERAYEAMNH